MTPNQIHNFWFYAVRISNVFRQLVPYNIAFFITFVIRYFLREERKMYYEQLKTQSSKKLGETEYDDLTTD